MSRLSKSRWRCLPMVPYEETLQQSPMGIVHRGALWWTTPSTLRAKSLKQESMAFSSYGPIWGNTPAIADGDCSLRCAVVDHSIDSESRVA